MTIPPAQTLLGFTRQVMAFVSQWDDRSPRPTRIELDRIAQWWNESRECCPEAIAMDVRMVYPSAEYMRQLTAGKA